MVILAGDSGSSGRDRTSWREAESAGLADGVDAGGAVGKEGT